MKTVLPPRRQRGVAMILVALSLAALVGFVGLVVDLAHLLITKTELQNAADACALAAARELTGDANALLRAENVGIAVGQRNRVDFQKTAVVIAPNDVTFSAALSPNKDYRSRLAGADPVKAKFAMCSLQRTGIAMWFMQQMGFGPQSVAAMGVASLGNAQTSCAIPVALCSTMVTGKPVGTWLTATFNTAESISGDFRWVNYPDYQGTKGLKDILAGNGVCNLPATGTRVGKPGASGGAKQAWNTRFGIYQGSYDTTSAPPDSSGFAYTTSNAIWPKGCCAYGDFSSVAEPNNSPYQTDKVTGLKTQGTVVGKSVLATSGNHQRRLATAPVVDCSEYDAGHTPQIQSWACMLMLDPMQNGSTGTMHVEYLGPANQAGSPCASYGLAGGTGGSGGLVPMLVQ